MTFWFSIKLMTMVMFRYLKYKSHWQARKRTCSPSWSIRKYFHPLKKGKAFTRKSESRQHGCWSQTPPFLRSHTHTHRHWQPSLTSTHKRTCFPDILTVQTEVYPSMCPTRPLLSLLSVLWRCSSLSTMPMHPVSLTTCQQNLPFLCTSKRVVTFPCNFPV